MNLRNLFAVTAICLVLEIGILMTTNPQQIGPVGVFSVFILGYLSLVGVIAFLIYFLNRLIKRLQARRGLKKVVGEITLVRAYTYALLLATLPMMLLSLNAAGRISVYEIGLLILFSVIGVFYVHKQT